LGEGVGEDVFDGAGDGEFVSPVPLGDGDGGGPVSVGDGLGLGGGVGDGLGVGDGVHCPVEQHSVLGGQPCGTPCFRITPYGVGVLTGPAVTTAISGTFTAVYPAQESPRDPLAIPSLSFWPFS